MAAIVLLPLVCDYVSLLSTTVDKGTVGFVVTWQELRMLV